MCTYVHVHQVQCGVLPQLTAEGLQLLVLVPVLVPYFLYLSQLLVISCSLAFHMHYSKCASYQCKLKPWFWRIGSIQVHAWPHHIPTNTATALSWRLKKGPASSPHTLSGRLLENANYCSWLGFQVGYFPIVHHLACIPALAYTTT